MIADNHYIYCPCGCKKVVPNNHFWATDACRQRARGRGIRMPIRYEKMRSRNRKKKVG
jgi:hypothetical protein